MQIGRRLYYDLTTGDVICDTGERQGDVVETTVAEDMAVYAQLSGRTTTNTGSVDYAFGDARFANGYAGARIDLATLALTVYLIATISTDKSAITANGVDTATVTVSGLSTVDPVTFSVNGGTGNNVTPANGSAVMSFSTSVAGSYTIQAKTAKNGTVSVSVKAS